MKSLIIFAFCLLMVANAERYIPNSKDPDSPENCFHKDLKLSIKLGETVKPTNIGECFELECNKDGLIRVNECGYYPTFDTCTITKADYTKEYPACCASAKCHQ